MPPMKRVLAGLATLLIAVTGLLFAAQLPAGASTATGTVSGTGADGLRVRAAPNTQVGSVGLLPEGTTVTIGCYRYGEEVDGYYYKSALWNYITSPVAGFVTDTFLYTGHDGPAPGVPECGTDGTLGGQDRLPTGAYTAPNQCGVADISFSSDHSAISINMYEDKIDEIAATEYSCLADSVITGVVFRDVSGYRTLIRNEIRNHAWGWLENYQRDHANPANIDLYAYDMGCWSGECWQWYWDMYALQH